MRHALGVVGPLVVAATLAGAPASAQSDSLDDGGGRLFSGDSVRINGEVVGRVLEIRGPMMTVVSHGRQRCIASQMHGEAPICDPPPIIRRQWDINSVEVERRQKKGNVAVRTALGGVLGAAAFGAAGYFVGPAIGFGRIDGCHNQSTSLNCTEVNGRTLEEHEAEQRRHDQVRGVLFFGVIGGTFTAIMARKLSVGWVRIQPTVPERPAEAWGLSFSVPTAR